MICFAHRGANSLAVENTVPAFEKARQLGARCYELDVQLTADKKIVVHHNYSLLETAGVDTQIGTLSYHELKNIPLRNRFSGEAVFVPLLTEILPIVAPELEILNIEIKNEDNRYRGIEEQLLQCLQRYPRLLPKILFSSFDYNTLVRLRSLAPSARIGLLTHSFDVFKALSLQAQSVHINQMRVTPQIIESSHQNNLKVYCYTVNDLKRAAQLAAAGVDGIFTDKIALFK